jgi:SAM-dependent methyltransferase
MTDTVAALQVKLDTLLAGRGRIEILEAGCGSASKIRFPAHARLTGIDISEKQLERNTTVDSKILGDIQTYPLADRAFDMIVCWDVLEHLPDPVAALDNFVRALAPDGLLLLALPNPASLKGLVTRLTPHGFHVWVYRHLLGQADAGTADTGPFPTHMRFATRSAALLRFAAENGLDVEHLELYEGLVQITVREKYPLVHVALRALELLAKVVSLGRWDIRQSEILLLLRRRR